jgi:hypothetical protein
VDVPYRLEPYSKVCGGKEAVARACTADNSCNAFTFGAEGDCGYLKRQYHRSDNPSQLAFKKSEGRGVWDVYVWEGTVPKGRGGALDCGSLKEFNQPLLKEACAIKQALPQVSGSLNV